MADTNIFYVRAKPSADGNFADCEYFLDKTAKKPLETDGLHIPQDSGECVIEQTNDTDLILIGVTYKTIGQSPSMNMSNFSPADDENAVTVLMPTSSVVTKGAVLLFSDRQTVTNLYPSSDPQITNDSVTPPPMGNTP